MSTLSHVTVEDRVAHVALPSRLSRAALDQIDTALTQLKSDDRIDVIVLTGTSAFPSGMTDPKAGGDDEENALSDICRDVETYDKPVIAMLSGTVVGGGAELALACHYRLAHVTTRIGFPHQRIGLIPHAGATQRLPRLVGAQGALDLLLGGQLVPVTAPALGPLVDVQFESDAFETLMSFIRALRDAGLAPRPTSGRRDGFADAQGYGKVIAKTRQRLSASIENAPKHILSCLDAAILLPIEAGLAFEQAAYDDCVGTAQSRALAYIFAAEQAAGENTRRRDLPQLLKIAVLGGGPFASQVVVSALEAGMQVKWVIAKPDQQRDSVGHVLAQLQKAVLSGRMSSDNAEQCRDALSYGEEARSLDDVDLALRAARGQRSVVVPSHVPLAHCLPGTDPKLALRLGPILPERRLLEIVLGPEGDDTDQRVSLAFARQMNLLAVIARSDMGSVSDRLHRALWRAADGLVDLGHSPYDIDTALKSWGMVRPPYTAADIHGISNVAKHTRPAGGTNWSRLLVEHGLSSFYTPDDSPAPAPQALALIDAKRAPQDALPSAQIVRLVLGAIANEGARMLRDAVVGRASDVDVVSVYGGIIPRWRGGVLHAVGADGLLQVTRAMTALDHPDQDFWQPEPIFADLIKNGRTFDHL